jgi:hypothetical protein
MPDAPVILANAVTGFATILGGVVTLLLTALVAPQPLRWRLAYWSILLTGIATVWYHGFGELFWPRVADVGTNYLAACVMIAAVLGDYYSKKAKVAWLPAVLLLNCFTVANMIATGSPNTRLVSYGTRGYTIRQVTLIVDALLVTGLLYVKYPKMPVRARALLNVQTGWFLLAAWLASSDNHRVDGVIAYHALWHIVGAFGFVLLWGFNQARFHPSARAADTPTRTAVPAP